jgi:RsiW-degrading membrane proteinase PrsW (M82 family)|tara:strand:- start:112 stop:960 length:849 start_codon:yes stop_codon:yes gene_type:complete
MFTDPSFLYISTVLPPILLGIIVWKSDRFPEPGKFLFASFLLGASIILPLQLFIMLAEDHLGPLLGLDISAYNEYIDGGYKVAGAVFPEAENVFQSFFRAAFLEEGIKFALLIFFCVRLSALNEPMDAIVYGAAIGLGYAAIENVGYLTSSSLENAWTIQMVKIRYYPLVMHMGFGILMGWLLSQNLFEERSIFKRRIMLILSLSLPIFFHGAYNYYGAASTFPLLSVIFMITIIYYHRREQLKKITESLDKARVENIEVFYSYISAVVLVALIVMSAIITK